MNVIVFVLGIIVLGFEGIPNLFKVVVLLVIAKESCNGKTYVWLTFYFPNSKKYLLHLEILYNVVILVFKN